MWLKAVDTRLNTKKPHHFDVAIATNKCWIVGEPCEWSCGYAEKPFWIGPDPEGLSRLPLLEGKRRGGGSSPDSLPRADIWRSRPRLRGGLSAPRRYSPRQAELTAS